MSRSLCDALSNCACVRSAELCRPVDKRLARWEVSNVILSPSCIEKSEPSIVDVPISRTDLPCVFTRSATPESEIVASMDGAVSFHVVDGEASCVLVPDVFEPAPALCFAEPEAPALLR